MHETNHTRRVTAKRVGRFVFTAFHLALIGFGFCLMIGPLTTAQPSAETRAIVDNLRDEVKEIKDQHLDSRLSVVEALLQEQKPWIQATSGGTGLLVIGGAITALRRRKTE